MINKSVITYIEPQSHFLMVSNSIIEKCNAEVIGVYCKIIKLSAGKSLSIDFIAKKINISDRKIRKIIVYLENEGYVVRKPIRDDSGYMRGWNYRIYAEPVPETERSHAGKKGKKEDGDSSVLPIFRQDGKSDKTENGKDNNILSKTEVLSNNKTVDNNKNKKPTNVGKKENEDLSLFPNDAEVRFEKFMNENYPFVMKMDIPLTLEQATKLKKEYGECIVNDVLCAMNNWKRLLKDNRFAYQTANNWCKRRVADSGKRNNYHKEELTEEPAVIYPEGMTIEKWTEISLWMSSTVSYIAGRITPVQFDDMLRTCGDSVTLAKMLTEINEWAEFHRDDDVYEEFKRRIKDSEL
jgi:hypothetical protein